MFNQDENENENPDGQSGDEAVEGALNETPAEGADDQTPGEGGVPQVAAEGDEGESVLGGVAGNGPGGGVKLQPHPGVEDREPTRIEKLQAEAAEENARPVEGPPED